MRKYMQIFFLFYREAVDRELQEVINFFDKSHRSQELLASSMFVAHIIIERAIVEKVDHYMMMLYYFFVSRLEFHLLYIGKESVPVHWYILI